MAYDTSVSHHTTPRAYASDSSNTQADDSSSASESMDTEVTENNTPIEWDWDLEHEDRKKETRADASLHNAQPFLVDRKLLKDVVREKMECEVGRITFLSSGEYSAILLLATNIASYMERISA